MDMSLSKRCSFHRKAKVLAAQPCPTLCNPVDYNPPGSSVPEFSKQEYWSGLPFLSPGDLPDSGIELQPPALQSHQGIPEKGGVHARPEGCNEDTGIGGVEGGFHILREWIRRNVVKNI